MIVEHSFDSLNFLAPEKVVRIFDLQKGDHVADFGAGHGFFAMSLAKAVGAKGRVYAVDIQKTVLEVTRAKARKEHLANIETLWADLEHPQGLPIARDFLDFVLIANILFQCENKIGLLKEAHRLLTEIGRLAIIEWSAGSGPLGPPAGMRVNKEKLREVCEKLGFKFLREFEAGREHYGLLFKK